MSIMAAQMGLAAISGIGDFMVSGIQADLQRATIAYQNTMNALSAARQKNAVTVNEIRTRDAGMRSEFDIQQAALQQEADAEVMAAAAGVAGNSVDYVMNDLRSSAAKAKYANRRNVNAQLVEMAEQKKTIDLNAIMGRNTQVIPKPSVGSMLLGVGTNLLKIYDSHQPEGQRVFDRLDGIKL